MPSSKELFLSLHDLRLHGELLAGEAERLFGERLRNAGKLEHHTAGLDHGDPALGRALAGAHARLGRLLREALVGKDVDPDLAAALDLARHRDTSRLDLAVRDPAGVECLEAVVAELYGRLAAREPATASAMHLAVLGLLRHQASPSFGPPCDSALGLRGRFGLGFSEAAGVAGEAAAARPGSAGTSPPLSSTSGVSAAGAVVGSATCSGAGVSAGVASVWVVSSVLGCSARCSRRGRPPPAPPRR